MANIYYIATTGSDTTGDGTSGTPWKTFAKVLANTVTGDTVNVGAGSYNEKLIIPNQTLTFNADGAVVLDGATGSLTTPAIAIPSMATATKTVTFQPKPTTAGTWTIQNYTGTQLINDTGSGSGFLALYLNKVTLVNNNNAYGVYLGSTPAGCTFANCIIGGFTTAIVYTTGNTVHTFLNNTFTASPNYGIQNIAGGQISNISGCSFTSIKYPICNQNSGYATASNNTYTNCGPFLWSTSIVPITWTAWRTGATEAGSTATNVYDGKVYVNKSGNDSNAFPYSPSTGKLTIQAGVTLMLSGDSVIVGSGNYNEKITITKYGSLLADGVVELDGNGLASNYLIQLGAVSVAGAFLIDALSTGGYWIFKNNVGTAIWYSVQNNNSYIFKNCKFISNSNTYGIYYNQPSALYMTIQNCIFSGFISAAIYTNGVNSTGTFTMLNSTLYNNLNGWWQTGGVLTVNIFYNIFHTCTTAYRTNQGMITSSSGYNQFYNITNWVANGTTYATFALLQAATIETVGSINAVDPQFEDAVNGIFYLKVVSPLGRTQGAIPFGYTTGSNASDAKWIVTSSADNSGWYSSDGNIAKNGTTGFFELVGGTSALLLSPVIDLGSVQAIKQINLGLDQTWPTSMIDTTNTDTKPNYQTVEIRGSGSTFTQNDAVISWTEVKTEQPISIVSGRYIQLRLTFRTNDVGA